jgi:hypothetical protein
MLDLVGMATAAAAAAGRTAAGLNPTDWIPGASKLWRNGMAIIVVEH